MVDPALGYLATCPSNVGTGMRASVMLRLPHLSCQGELLERLAIVLQLQVRGSGGEHTLVADSTYDISNKQRLGKTEVALVQELVEGVIKLVELEEMLEQQCEMVLL